MGKPDFNPIRDVFSGLIMAATSVPQLIAYAETVGLAGHRGLSTAGPPLFAYGLATGGPFMNAGVTSITALMAKADLDGEAYVAEYGEEEYVMLVSAYSLYIGIASSVLAVVGFGALAKSVPKPVRTGFKWGCAVGVLVSALPNGLFQGGGSQLKQLAKEQSLLNAYATKYKVYFPGIVNAANVVFALSRPMLWSLAPTVLFVAGTAFVMRGKNLLPSFLPPGTEVVLLTIVAAYYSLNFDYPGAIVGEIPAMDQSAGISLGPIQIPVEVIDISKLWEVPLVERCFGGSIVSLVLTSLLFAAVNFLSILGIASGFESENGVAWSAPRELLAQGVGCVAAALVGSPPVSGSMSRSLVSRMTGATSQLACLVTALVWIYLQPYMSVMEPTPKAALSAVIVSAVLEGIVLPKGLLQLKGTDAIVGWATGVVTVLTSPTQGFAAGLVLFGILHVLVGKSVKEKSA